MKITNVMVLAVLSLAIGLSYAADASAQTPTGAVDDPGITSNSVHIATIDVLANDVSGATITGVTQPTSPKGHISAIGASHGTTSHNGTHVTWTPDPWSSPDLYPYVRHIPITFNYTITAGGTSDTAKVNLNITRGTANQTSTATVSYERAYHPDAIRDSFAVDTLETVVLDVLANDTVHATDAAGDTLTIAGTDKLRAVLASGYYSRDPNFAGTISHNDTHITYTPSTNVTARPTVYTVIFEYSVTDGKNIAKALAEIAVDTTIVNNRVDDTVIDILKFHGPIAAGRTIASLEVVTQIDTDRVGELSHNGTHITFDPGDGINEMPYPVPNGAELVFRYTLTAQEGITRTAIPDYDDLRGQENGTLLVAIAEENARNVAASGSKLVEVTIVLRDDSDFAVFGDTVRSLYRTGNHTHTLDVLSNDILPDGATITSVSPLRLDSYLTQDQIAQWLSQNASRVCADDIGADGSIGIKCDNLAEITQQHSLGSLGIAADGRSITYTEAGPYRVSSESSDNPVNIEIPNLYTSTTLQYPLVFDYTVTAGTETRNGTVWLVNGEPLSDADSPLVAVDDNVMITPDRNQAKYPSAKILVLNNDRAEGATFTIAEHPSHGSVAIRDGNEAIVCGVDLNLEDLVVPENGTISINVEEIRGKCDVDEVYTSYGHSAPRVVYTADEWYTGTDSFEYTITRGGIESDTATVNIDIETINRHVVIDQSSIPNYGVHITPTGRTYYDDRVVIGDEQGAVTFTVRATDQDGTPITFGLEGGEENMRIDPNTGVFTWDPDNQQRGLNEFKVTATSGGDTARATVKIQVVAENLYRPITQGDRAFNSEEYYNARDDITYMPSGTTASIDVLANDQCGGDETTSCSVFFDVEAAIANVIAANTSGAITADQADERIAQLEAVSRTTTWTNSSVHDTLTGTNTTLSILEGPSSNGDADIIEGEIVYIPNTGFTGTDELVYELAITGPAYREVNGQLVKEPSEYTDADGPIVLPARLSLNATLTIHVREAFDSATSPVNDDRFSVPFGATTVLDVLENDAPGVQIGGVSTATNYNTARNGTVALVGNTILYTSYTPDNPDRPESITDGFTYTVTHNGRAYTASVLVTVTDRTTAASDRAYTQVNGTVLIDVLGNDIIRPGATVTIQSVTQPANGETQIMDDKVRYDPRDGYTGTDTFEYTISDGTGTFTASVTVTVSALARANADSVTTAQGRATIIDVLSNDINTEGATVTLTQSITITTTLERTTVTYANGTIVRDENGVARNSYTWIPTTETAPAPSGTVEVLPDNTIRYTSPDDYTGTDTFFYRISQASGQVSDAQVTVNVTSINDEAFTLQDDPVLIPVLDNDLLGDDADILLVYSPLYGSAAPQDNGTILYTPASGYTGTDTFRYTASDGTTTTGTVDVTVTVAGPLVAPDITVSTPVNTTLKIQIIDDPDRVGLGSAVDPPNGSLEKTPGRNTVVENGTHLTYTPNPGFVGTDTFPYSLTRTSTGETTSTATVTITVGASDDTAEALEGETITIDVLTNDGTTGYSLDGVSDPPRGSATHDATAGTVTYTPDDGFVGTDTFTYTTSASGGTPELTPTVTVEVMRIAVDDTARVREDSGTGVNVYVLQNDNLGRTLGGNEAAGIVANATISDPQNGTASQTDSSNSFITYRPDPGFSGIDTFTYTLDHVDTPRGNETSVTATVTVTVTQVTDQLDFEIPQSISEYSRALPIEGFNLGNIPMEQEYVFTANVTENVDNVPYRFELGAVDVDGSPIGMTIPDDATLTPEGVFAWTPTAEQTGTHLIGVKLVPLAGDLLPTSKIVNLCVADEPSISHIDDIEVFAGEQVTANITLNSACPTGLPMFTLAEAPEDATLFGYRTETVTLAFGVERGGLPMIETLQVERRVPVPDQLNYLSTQRNIDGHQYEKRTYFGSNNDFAWTPGPVDVTTNYTVTIRAAGLDIADQTFTITVKPGNKAPEFTVPYRYYALEVGEEFYSVPFRDTRFLSDDGHELNPDLTYSVSDDKPAGLSVVAYTYNGTIDGTSHWIPTDDEGRHDSDFPVIRWAPVANETGPYTSDFTVIHWTPTADDAGRHEFNFTVSDGQHEDTMRIIIHVLPQLSASDDTVETATDTPVIIRPLDNDGSNGTIIVNYTSPASGAIRVFDKTFLYTPNPGFDGIDRFEYTTQYQFGANTQNVTANVAITVSSATTNRAPEITAIGDQTVDEGAELTFTVQATDPDGNDTVEYALFAAPHNAELNASSGAFAWTPTEVQDGPHVITIGAVDNGSAAAVIDINVDVTEVNVPTTNFEVTDTTANLGVLLEHPVRATDPDQTRVVTEGRSKIVPQITFGLEGEPDGMELNSVTQNGDLNTANIEWMPNVVGNSVFNVTVTDGDTTLSQEITITVADTTPPVIRLNGSATLEIQVNDPYEDPGATVTDNDPTYNGTVTATPATIDTSVVANHTVTYSAPADAAGNVPESVNRTVRIVEENMTTAPPPVNRAPVLGDLREFTIINAERSHNFTVEAEDADGDPLTFNLTGDVPENATIGQTDGLFEWTPSEPGQLGNHTFTITVSDGRGESDSATITLQVVGANDTANNPPLLRTIGAQNVDEGQTLEIRPVADDLEGDSLTYELTRGTLPAAATFNTTNGHLDWTPGEEDGGATHDITITVSDQGGSDSEDITITVTETNQNPVISDVPLQTATVGQALTVTLNATDADLPAQTLEYDITGDDLGATITGNTLSWTPTSAHAGNQSLTVRVQDDFSPRGSDTTTISFTVSGDGTTLNTAPTAADFDLPVQAPNAGTVDLAAAGHINDAEQAPGTLGVTLDTSTLTLGSATVTGTTITYTPNGPEGTDTMTYTVTDNEGATDTGTITITVTAQPITVTAADDSGSVDEGATVTIDVLGNDQISPTNIPRSALEITRLDRASHGQATTDGNTVVYTANTFGTDPTPTRTETLEYTVRVQGGNSDTATITITINNINMPPVAQDSTSFVAVNSTDVMIPLSVSDPDGDMPLTVTITGQPTLGRATVSETSIIYTPNVNVTGTDTITYRVADPEGASTTATLTIIIAAFGGGSDSGNDWRKAPTFGRSFNTDEMIVSCGYSMDGECRDVTDYHVDYERQTIETGSTHDFTLRAYGDQTLEMFQLGFGMPQIGSPLNTAEALIEITVSPNYDPDSSGYDVTEVVYRNPNNVIDEDAVITARDIACAPGSELVCVQIDIRDVTFREQMYHEPFGIFVMDTDRRSSTFYMNEGLLVEGESLNPAPTAIKSTKSGNQAETLTLQLTRTDKLSNIWTDQIGNRWTQNEYGTWLLIYAVPSSFATACTDEDNRYCDAFQTRLDVHHDALEDIRDDRYGDIYTTPAYDDLTEAITILDMDGDSRTAFLEQNGMMWIRQGN